jgi:hypothetical protein
MTYLECILLGLIASLLWQVVITAAPKDSPALASIFWAAVAAFLLGSVLLLQEKKST